MTAPRLDTAIAVTGMACRFPAAADVEAFWQNLCDARSGIRHFDRAQLKQAGVADDEIQDPHFVPACAPIPSPYAFDAVHFGIAPSSAEQLDLQHRVLLECAWTALELSGTFASAHGPIGVFAGCSDSRLDTFAAIRNRDRSGTLTVPIGSSSDYLAARLAFTLDLQGPAVTVRAACATSLVAVHLAISSLLSNECDVAVAGAVAIRHPLIRGHLHDPGGMYSSDGFCRPYDHLGSGIVSGDGAGAVVLRRFHDALMAGDHIHAVICGSAINNDGGRKATFSSPSVIGQAEAAVTAFEVADIDPATIGFVEGHGTGTPMGDPIEIAALTKVWNAGSRSTERCALGSVKSNLGHLDAAAGMAALIKAILVVERGYIPATLNYTAPNPHSNLENSPFVVSSETSPWTRGGVRRASVHSLGMGGTNAHLVLEQAPLRRSCSYNGHRSLPLVFPISTRRAETMPAYIASLANAAKPLRDDLSCLAATLQYGRVSEPYRHVVVAQDAEEMIRMFGSLKQPVHTATRPHLVVAFSADGKMNVSALEDLAQHFPEMRAQVERSAMHLRNRWDIELDDVLHSAEPLPLGLLAATVALGVAVHAVLKQFGVGGDMVIGQSLGELTAAAASGLIDVEDAVDFAMAREHAFRTITSTAVLAVSLPPEELDRLLPANVELSVVNSPSRCVVSGESQAIDALEASLLARDIAAQRLEKISAVHSSFVDPVVDDIRIAAARLRPKNPERTLMSSVGPSQISVDAAATSEHWVRHFRDPMRFDLCVRAAVSSFTDCVMLDVGPADGLFVAIHETVGRDVRSIVRLLPPMGEGVGINAFAATLGALWTHGVEIDWSAWPRSAKQRIALPVPPLLPSVFESFGGWQVLRNESTHPEPQRPADVGIWARTWRRVREPLDDYSCPGRRILMLSAANDFSRIVSDRLRTLGHDVCVVDSMPPRAECSDDIVVDARGLDAADGSGSATTAAFLRVVAAVGSRAVESQNDGPRRVVALTRGAFDILGSEKLSPSSAALACSAIVAAQEHRELIVACIDIDEDANADVVARLLSSQNGLEPSLGVRGRALWRPSVELLQAVARSNVARAPSVCVITGGLGRYGRWIGRWLAESGCRRLFIVTRSCVVPAEASAAIASMRDDGCDVTVETCDVTDRDRFVGVLDKAARLDANDAPTIFHLAASLNAPSGFAPIADLARGDMACSVQEQWFAKVGGAMILRDWARAHPKACCVLFSSTSAVLGGPGLAAYAAANAALDALASAARNDEDLNWHSIAWDGWRLDDDKPGSSASTSAALEAVALRGHEPWEALNDALAVRSSHLIAVKGNFAERYKLWVEGRGTMGVVERTEGPFGAKDDPHSENSYLNPLRRIWADLLGSQPDDDADLFQVGGDSLTALRIRSGIERELGKNLSLKAVLENRTISKLSSLLGAERAEDGGSITTHERGDDKVAPTRIVSGKL